MTHSFKRILVPVDFSAGSKAAVDYALAFAKPLGAELELLHAFHVSYHVRPDLSVWSEAHGHRSILDIIETEAQADMRIFLHELGDDVRKRVSGRVVHGEAVSTILEASENGIDLIIMGTHGRTGLARVALGSVAERVVRHAHCPVLTVGIREAAA